MDSLRADAYVFYCRLNPARYCILPGKGFVYGFVSGDSRMTHYAATMEEAKRKADELATRFGWSVREIDYCW